MTATTKFATYYNNNTKKIIISEKKILKIQNFEKEHPVKEPKMNIQMQTDGRIQFACILPNKRRNTCSQSEGKEPAGKQQVWRDKTTLFFCSGFERASSDLGISTICKNRTRQTKRWTGWQTEKPTTSSVYVCEAVGGWVYCLYNCQTDSLRTNFSLHQNMLLTSLGIQRRVGTATEKENK